MFFISDFFRTILVDVSFLILLALVLILVIGPIALIIYFIYAANKGTNTFTRWTVLTLILCILNLSYGIISAIIEVVTYLITKDRINNAKQEKAKSQNPNPGSDADYDRWKQERQSRDQ